MSEGPSEAPSSREVSCEPEWDKEEDDISEDGEEEEEEDIFNPKQTSYATSETRNAMQGKNYCKWVVWKVPSEGELLPHDVILSGYY